MENYHKIDSQADIDLLLDRVAGFQDSVTHEIHVLSRGWVGPDRGMLCNFTFDARVVIHSQLVPFVIELVLRDVVELTTYGCDANDGALVRSVLDEHECGAIEFRFEGGVRVVARHVFYALRPESWLGPRPRLGTEIPDPEAVPAKRLDDRWRQCTNCWDAWQETEDVRFAACPTCRSMTDAGERA